MAYEVDVLPTTRMMAGMADRTPAPVEKPRIQQQIDQLAKVLSACQEIASSLEMAADRIIGAAPQGSEKDGPKMPLESVEQKLAGIISFAETLHGRLQRSSQRFNAAV